MFFLPIFFIIMKKRYQFRTKNGIEWTNWFNWNSTLRDKWQLKNRLLNEYKEDLCSNC